MKINITKFSKLTMRSLGLALLVIVTEVMVYASFIVKGIIDPEVIVSSTGFILVSAVNSFCCLFIVKYNLISILFVSILINAFVLVMAFYNTVVWVDPWWVPFVGGWVWCMMASIIGALLRKRTSVSHIQLQRG